MAGRGGLQQPKNPAAVSNPGSGRRTDGGAGSKSQPVRVPSGGAYGQRQAAEAQQSAAPMAAGGPEGGPPQGAAPQGGGAAGGVFGPSERPGEPATYGAMTGPQAAANNVDHLIRTMYASFPHPAIAQLMKKEPERRAPSQ